MGFYKYITFLVSWWITYEVSGQIFQCNSTDACLCTTIRTSYEYQCPLEETQIVVKVQPQYGINVQCIKDDLTWSDQELPQINVGNVKTFTFRKCPLPDNISRFMNSFGVYKVKTLKFDFITHSQRLTADLFYGLTDLETLTLCNNRIENVDEDAFRYLPNLTDIDLSANSLKLTPNLLRFTNKLIILDLAMNNLESIPEELFYNLDRLEILFLWSNNFTTVNGSVFRDLVNLKTLELSHCHIRHLPYDAFHSLQSLKAINLGMNEFETVPANLFVRNPRLELIKMESNPRLRNLPDYLFSNLTHLKSVELFYCGLDALPENLFFGSSHLENVSLRHNELRTLPENIFKDLSELKKLDLSENNLESLPENIFLSLSNLKRLNLANNKLIYIGSKLFFGLLRLEMVNLSYNQITTIHKYSFQRLAMLKELIMSHNYLALTENFTTVSPFNSNLELEKVDLSYNNITCISEDWMFSKVHLRELDFSYNQIDHLNFNYLVTVSHKLEINLSHNRINVVNFTDAEVLARSQGNLDMYSSNAPNTVVLLDENPINCDCHIYDFVRYFRRDIDPTVPTLVTIKADNLTCNSPGYLSEFSVKDLSLKMLTCGLQSMERNANCPSNCNCIVRPWDKALLIDCNTGNFSRVPALVFPQSNHFNHTEIDLSNNNITSGPLADMGYENVTVLDLSSNNIDSFQWVPPKLKSLVLERNNISFLNYEVLEMLNRSMLKNIALGDNPWDCDCQIANFSDFLVTHLPQQQIDVKNIKCRNSGELVVQLDLNELCQTYRFLTIGVSVGIAVLALLVAAITIFYYHYELEIKVWLYAHNMLLWLISEEEVDKDKLYDAFISYSHQDEDFLMNQLLPVLEQGPKPYKLCIHIRDFIAGEFISTQIVNSVANSRRTIVILSPSFLQSRWGKMEFCTAHTKSVTDGRRRLIVIVYGDVDLEKDLDDELKAYIKTNTYVKWGDPWFWDKLRYALPHSKIRVGRKSQNIMMTMNDKIDLLNNIPSTPNSGTTPPAVDMEPPLLLKDHPLSFRAKEILTPPAEAGLKPLLIVPSK